MSGKQNIDTPHERRPLKDHGHIRDHLWRLHPRPR